MKYNSLIGKVAIFITLVFSITLLVNFPIEVEAQNAASQSTINREIIFGLRDNAPPVSDFREHRDWEGYCENFLNSLEKDIKQKEGKANITKFKIERKTVEKRFTGYVENRQVAIDAECGPNTDNPDRRDKIEKEGIDGQFSETFAVTGAKILLKKANAKYFYRLQPFEGKKIGVVEGTTTDNFIGKRYGEEKIKPVKREQVVQQLEKGGKEGGIDAYVSDEIILKGILNEMDPWQRINYIIVPKSTSLSYEKY